MLLLLSYFFSLGFMITFNDFEKIDLRVAKITKAECIEGSQKLLRLEIDVGDEKRQLIAGLAKSYEPQNLVGREIVVIANLKPKIIFGFKSQGMLLAADIDGKPILLQPEKDVPPGTKIY